MKKLATKIINFAKEYRACDEQLNPALAAYEAGDYETVLDTARGSINWLKHKGFEITDELLNGRAIEWHDNGQLACECTYKNGVLEGLYREWHENGQLGCECTYKNGQREGLLRSWHANGQLAWECTYKNGVLIKF